MLQSTSLCLLPHHGVMRKALWHKTQNRGRLPAANVRSARPMSRLGQPLPPVASLGAARYRRPIKRHLFARSCAWCCRNSTCSRDDCHLPNACGMGRVASPTSSPCATIGYGFSDHRQPAQLAWHEPSVGSAVGEQLTTALAGWPCRCCCCRRTFGVHRKLAIWPGLGRVAPERASGRLELGLPGAGNAIWPFCGQRFLRWGSFPHDGSDDAGLVNPIRRQNGWNERLRAHRTDHARPYEQ